MKIQTLGLVAAIGALAITAGATLASCSQPPIECTAGHGDFAVQYKFVSGDATCNTKFPDVAGFQVYNPLTNEDTCEPHGDDKLCDGTEADSSKIRFAIQTFEMGNTVDNAVEPDPDAMHEEYSIGDVKDVLPDANHICYVDTLSAAEQNLPVVPGEGGAGGGVPNLQEATSVKYEWSNMKVFVTAAVPGTQFEADVKYTNNGCSATFKAVGMYPAIFCGTAVDDDMDPMTPDVIEMDPSLCNPNPDPEKGRAFGSGINPDFPIKCVESPGLVASDPTHAALCVLDSTTVPALLNQ